MDDLFPRVEIDALLKGTTILANSKSDAWKTKKEGLESLQAILDQGANKRLKPAMGNYHLCALRPALTVVRIQVILLRSSKHESSTPTRRFRTWLLMLWHASQPAWENPSKSRRGSSQYLSALCSLTKRPRYGRQHCELLTQWRLLASHWIP